MLKDCDKGNEYVIMFYRTNVICILFSGRFMFWKFRLGKAINKKVIHMSIWWIYIYA